MALTVGVLALQGGFAEHLNSLTRASLDFPQIDFFFIEVRTPEELSYCDGLIIPGGESTTLSFVASQMGLLEHLRHFVKVLRKPVWGTCAGLIFLCESASGTKKGGQELVGGLDVKVHRNHFGRQRESFVTEMNLPFLRRSGVKDRTPFPAVFIRAPVVEKLLAKNAEVLAVFNGRGSSSGKGDIVALRQGNVFGTSFHPELTDDTRIHSWWLEQVVRSARPN